MKRSSFSLSHKKNLAMNMGDLVPIGLQEVLPGDQFQHSTSALIRVQPILAPVMSPVFCMVHHFFVPARLLWDEWEDFITGGEDGESTPTPPYMISPPSTGYAVGSLADYLGIPPDKAGLKHSALPFRAIALIYNEWFRDQDLDAKLPMVKTSGLDSTTNLTLPKVSWQKDYFTTARPWPQKGPDVFIPLGQSAPVVGIGTATSATFPTANLPVKTSDGNKIFANSGNPPLYVEGTLASASGLPMIRADLSEASAVTITDLRTAAALQRYYEKMAQFGSRYVEYLRSIFGVKSSDARLQRPEYLGGGMTPIQWSEVLQTAEGTDPVGTLRGHGITGMKSNRYRRFFEEHGYVISFLSVKPETMYVQGLHRMWSREVKEDYFVPEFQHIGQQEVLSKEIYADGTSADNDVFGYQDRYDEYRSCPSSIAGEFRTTLDFWHMARIFASRPVLNSSFVKANPTDRIFAVTGVNQLAVTVQHSIQARRPLAKRATSFLK